jgi:menaquinone-9 beta-reductase
MGKTYDVVTIGGGLGGAGFARLMAKRGARVLVLERTNEFKDRIRGEVLVPWGVAEAKRLGFAELLRPFANDLIRWDIAVGGQVAISRDLVKQSTLGLPVYTYYHPEMQDAVLQTAEDAGAEVRRGAKVTLARPGKPPSVKFDHQGSEHEVTARIVVGADGRGSVVRKWGGFATERDVERRLFAGVLFDDMPAPEDVLYLGVLPGTGLMTYVFPQGKGRVRCYVGFQKDTDVARFQGANDVPRFVETALKIGVPKEWYDGARANGPLATFDATDEWVPHPYKDGIALVGDAASTSDPTWGQGMSVTLRDLRLLRDALAESDDWDAAGHAYAKEHAAFHREVHTADGWYTDIFLDVGAEADARRARALPLILQDPTRIIDTPIGGPEIKADESARRRFFGED